MFKELKLLTYVISRRRDTKHEIVFYSFIINMQAQFIRRLRYQGSSAQPLGRVTAEAWKKLSCTKPRVDVEAMANWSARDDMESSTNILGIGLLRSTSQFLRPHFSNAGVHHWAPVKRHTTLRGESVTLHTS